ncbi:endo-1,5-alpha-L-arabinosidase [Ascodesmis nigricans]|uniref:Arabinan endo-1,5-alpha-L-arabinosidase n=1 Tax=Ascodesmis nigricans TaxID=341454 RepID=A0A4S2MUI4_9PEZI|nr:endo-1,5-alpha-L-arabinosidase [Ascodesmis nigricans]
MLPTTLIFGILSLVLSAVSVLAAPGACSVIRRDDGTYFRFSTGHRIEIATSRSLSGPWTIQGSAIPGGSKINLPGRDDLWAPDIIKSGSLYYLYYSVSTFGSQSSAIGVATSPSMDAGTWTDHGATGVSSKAGSAYNAIDANLVEVPGEGWKMTFGSFWRNLYQVPMQNPPLKNSGSSYQVAYNASGAHAIEGPTVYLREGYYYLFFSSGSCCGLDQNRPKQGEEYRIMVCRSRSATGGYVDRTGRSCLSGGGTTVLASNGNTYAPGGQGVFADPASGGTILYYHYIDKRIGYADGDKRFGWNVLSWSGGWPTA